MEDRESTALERVLKACTISAGARSAWLAGVVDPKARVSDGEGNSVGQNLLCINGFTDVAGSAGITSDDPRLVLPIFMGEKR
jgi:hypothetical protein